MTQAFNLSQFANKVNTSGQVDNTGLQNSAVTVTAGTGLSGGGAVSLGSSVTLNNAGVTSLTAGTGISLSAGTGAVTITNSNPAGGFEFISTTSLVGLSTLTISGLNLTSYQQLYLYVGSFSPSVGGTALRINGINEVLLTTAANTFSASWLIDLNTGINLAATALIDTTLGSVGVAGTPYTTLIKKASTSFTISVVNSGTFDSGSISIYGVK